MGGSYVRQADGTLIPVAGPALETAPGPEDLTPETPADPIASDAEEQPK
jgi:hypothetical protein